MKRVAVLGAAGFIGNRTVEMLHRGGNVDVIPVARRPAGLALASRFAIRGAVADALDEDGLKRAFTGCDAVVASIAGPPATIVGVCEPIVRAAKAAGVRRIVHLSSQMVHGQSLPDDVTEESPLPRRQPIAYNRAKARAERVMRSVTSSAGVDLILLRPGIVYGPRSRWTGGIADELLAGEAFLVRDVEGACNAVYVDNLVHAIELALDADSGVPTGSAFFINDQEKLHWADLLEPVADALGLSAEAIRRPTFAEAAQSSPSPAREQLLHLAKTAFRALPRSTAHILRAARTAALDRRGGTEQQSSPYSREQVLLQSNRVHLCNDKAAALLGYRPAIPHAEAMRRSIAWLQFAGYAVR